MAVGCSAHGLALLFKDLAKAQHCKWTAVVYATALMMSNAIGDSERMRALLHEHQLALHGRTKALTVHAPTRFAVMHFVLGDLVANKASLTAMVTDHDRWPTASSGSSKGVQLRKAVLAGDDSEHQHFWPHADRAQELMQPVSDAIHKLEADNAFLSQVCIHASHGSGFA